MAFQDFREMFLVQHKNGHTAEVADSVTGWSYQDSMLRDGVTHEEMRTRVGPGINSLAWLLWHMTRLEDIAANLILANQPQVFDEGEWAAKLNVARRDLGTGMTDAEVDEFNEQIDVAALLAYRVAVGRRTQEVIRNLQPETMSEVIDADLVQKARDAGVFGPNAEWLSHRWEGKLKAFTLTHSLLGHSFFHFGQGEVVRAMLGYDVV